MSKNNPSEMKLAVPTSDGLSGLKSLNLQVFVTIAAIVAIMLFFTWITDGAYLSACSVSNLLRRAAIAGILAVGMMFIIISAEINLPIGSMMGLLGGVATICDIWLGWPLPLTIIVTSVLGLLLDAWNGRWVAYHEAPSFIVILAGMLAFRDILIGITSGTTVSPTSAAMSQVGQSHLPANTNFIIGALGLTAFVGWQWRGKMRRWALGSQFSASTAVVSRQTLTVVIVLGTVWLLSNYRGVSTSVLLLMLLLLGGMFTTTRAAFGRRIYTIGDNLEAVRLSGINIERTKLAAFAINGLVVVVAGLVLSFRLGADSPSAGNIAELDVITAYVIGGTNLADGVGSVAEVVMRTFTMASLDNGMSMMDVPTFWQYVAKGTVLLLAVWMDPATKHRS